MQAEYLSVYYLFLDNNSSLVPLFFSSERLSDVKLHYHIIVLDASLLL